MAFPGEVNLDDWISDSSDSDKFFGLGEDVDEGFCDSDDNNSHYLPSETVEDSQVRSSSKHGDDDAGYGEVDKMLEQNPVNPDAFLFELGMEDPFLPPSPSSLMPSTGFLTERDGYLEGPVQSPFNQVSTWPGESSDLCYRDPYQQTVTGGLQNYQVSTNAVNTPRDTFSVGMSVVSSSSAPLLSSTSICMSQPICVPSSAVHTPAYNCGQPESSCSKSSKQTTTKGSPIPGYSETALVDMPYTEFNNLIKKLKLAEDAVSKAKDIRKKGKNKAAARNCRQNKVNAIVSLEKEVHTLRQQLSQCSLERDSLLRELQVVKSRCVRLEYQSRVSDRSLMNHCSPL